MTKTAKPHWTLNDDWAVSTDTYNWILYQRSGKSWKAIGYYPSPEMMLESLHRKIALVEPPQPTLEKHVKHCLGLAQTAATRLLDNLATYPLPVFKARPATVSSMLKREIVNHAS